MKQEILDHLPALQVFSENALEPMGIDTEIPRGFRMYAQYGAALTRAEAARKRRLDAGRAIIEQPVFQELSSYLPDAFIRHSLPGAVRADTNEQLTAIGLQ